MHALQHQQEENIVFNSGFEVQLGGKAQKLKKLSVGKSREWRAKAEMLDNERMRKVRAAGTELEEDVAGSVRNNALVFSANPDYVIDLVIEFCESQSPPISRDWIEENATDQEIAAAFGKILETVCPFDLVMGGSRAMRKILNSEG